MRPISGIDPCLIVASTAKTSGLTLSFIERLVFLLRFKMRSAPAPRTCRPTATALLRIAPVGMTEVLFWGDTVADELLEFLQLGEAAALLARP